MYKRKKKKSIKTEWRFEIVTSVIRVVLIMWIITMVAIVLDTFL